MQTSANQIRAGLVHTGVRTAALPFAMLIMILQLSDTL